MPSPFVDGPSGWKGFIFAYCPNPPPTVPVDVVGWMIAFD